MSSEVAVEMQGGKWKRYPAYRDSGVEWLGEVPEHWRAKRLKYITTVNDETLSETTDPDFELVYVDIGSIDPISGIRNKETMTFENAPSRARRKVRNGDVIISTVRTYLRAISPVNDAEPNMVVSIAAYTLRAPYFVDKVVANSVGVSYPAINASELINFNIAHPPLPEQRAIAAFLDRETGRIDTLIQKKERQIELLQEKRAALISHAVTKGLDPEVKMEDSRVEWLGEVPEHWGASKIIRYAYLKTGGTPDRNNMAYWENGTINWISSGEVNKKKIFETNNKITSDGLANSNAMILPINSIMVALNGQGKTKGTVAILKIESSCNQSLAAFICDEKKLYFNYLFYYLESKYKELRGLVGDSLRDGLSLGHLKSIDSPLPPIFEQRAIAAFIDRETGRIDTLTTKVRESISKLREYRTALISAAVTGKIDVRSE